MLDPTQDAVEFVDGRGDGILQVFVPHATAGIAVIETGAGSDDDLVATLRAAGLGVLVDLVPNHMGVAVPAANPSWWSLLREGAGSPYAAWYDADLSDLEARPLLIPVLGSPEDVEALVMPEQMTANATRNVAKWMPKALCVYSAAPAACGYLHTSSR